MTTGKGSMTRAAAIREARLILGENVGGSESRCGGQMVRAGMPTTRGCGSDHLQPCPGGPMIYSIYTESAQTGIRGYVSRGESWQDAIDKLRALYPQLAARADAAKAAKPSKAKAR